MASASCKWNPAAKGAMWKGIKNRVWTFLVVQCLRIHLAMQGTLVQSPVREDPTCLRAAEPRCQQLMNLHSGAWELQLLKPTYPRICAPKQEKPARWGALTLQLEFPPPATCSNKDSPQPKIKMIKTNEYFFKKGQGVCLTGFSWGFCCLERILSKKTWFFFFFLLVALIVFYITS